MTGPDVFALPHLSEDAVAAFADGVLSAAATSRARRHCSECPECADAVRIQREAAMFLRCAQAPAMPAGLLDRLSGLPMSAPLPPPRSGLPTVLGADGVPMFVAYNPATGSRAGAAPAIGTASTAGTDSTESTDSTERTDSTGATESTGAADDRAESTSRSVRKDTGSSDPHAVPAERRVAGPAHRRASLPLTMLASAAAVVAAGALGGQVSALSAAADLPSSSSAVRVAPADAAGAFTATPIGQRVTTGQSAPAPARTGLPPAAGSTHATVAQPPLARAAARQAPAGQLPAARRGAAGHRIGTILDVPGAGHRLPVLSLRTVAIHRPGPADGRFTPAP